MPDWERNRDGDSIEGKEGMTTEERDCVVQALDKRVHDNENSTTTLPSPPSTLAIHPIPSLGSHGKAARGTDVNRLDAISDLGKRLVGFLQLSRVFRGGEATCDLVSWKDMSQ